MIRIDMKEFDESAATCIAKVRAGEIIIITENEEPVVEMRRVAAPAGHFNYGFAKGLVEMPDSFWDSLPDDEIALWSGAGA